MLSDPRVSCESGMLNDRRGEGDAQKMAHGFLLDRLGRIAAHVDRYVEGGRYPGAMCLVSRGGEVGFFHQSGYADVERQRPMARDTVLRLYSMTKPITSSALMMLYEEGLFQLDDPVAKHVDSWSDLTVFDRGDEERYVTVAPDAPMTIKHLLTHTSGLTYGFMNEHPVDAMYRRDEVTGNGTLKDMMAKLAGIPLKFSPGTQWSYSVATDVCGYLVEHFSGRPLDEYVADHITGPLGMRDSGFHVKASGTERLAACYQHEGPAKYRLQDDPVGSRYHTRPTFFSGGGGMVGTIDDYHRFALMLLGKGELDGTRLLGRKTVEYMTTNHLPGNCDLAAMGQPVFSETSYEGIGFGLGFSVVVDPAAANVLDSPGEFAWGGAASTYFWVDPVEELIVVFATQLLPSSAYPIRRELKTLVYQALA